MTITYYKNATCCFQNIKILILCLIIDYIIFLIDFINILLYGKSVSYYIMQKISPRGPMDKTQGCGPCNAGSNPTEGTFLKPPFN